MVSMTQTPMGRSHGIALAHRYLYQSGMGTASAHSLPSKLWASYPGGATVPLPSSVQLMAAPMVLRRRKKLQLIQQRSAKPKSEFASEVSTCPSTGPTGSSEIGTQSKDESQSMFQSVAPAAKEGEEEASTKRSGEVHGLRGVSEVKALARQRELPTDFFGPSALGAAALVCGVLLLPSSALAAAAASNAVASTANAASMVVTAASNSGSAAAAAAAAAAAGAAAVALPGLGPPPPLPATSLLWSHFLDTLSKTLGFLIVGGSLFLKVPQILRILKSKSVEGLSALTFELECVGFTMALSYCISKGVPFHVYGELFFILFQSIVLVGLLYFYSPKMKGKTAKVLVYLAAAATLFSGQLPPQYLELMYNLQTFMFGVARLPQIWTNFKNESTGELSLTTSGLSAAGCLARLFTNLHEHAPISMAVASVTGMAMQGILVTQILYYAYKPQYEKVS